MWERIKSKLFFSNNTNEKLVTSYFSNLKKLKELNYTPISICGKPPCFYNGLEMKILAPKYSFFKEWKENKINNDDYIKLYYNLVLKNMNPKEIYNIFFQKSNQNKVVLLCYEKPFDFCHRHIISVWFNHFLKINIPEIKL